jgi:hypothetical protein
MKKLAILAVLVLAGCAPAEPAPVTVNVLTGNVAKPATDYSLMAAFTAALPCAGQPLAWSIREQGIGWTATDGGITQGGVWTSPACGSVWLGQVLHIDASCPSGQTATATIATVPEQLSGVQIAYAVRTAPAPACLFPDPANLSGMPPGGTVQLYARVITSCGEVVTPEPPATWPAACQ